jgi:protein-S-isoprenylcysteine O-methyltransferase Ste14
MNLLSQISAALPAQLPLLLGWVLYALFHSLTASTACKNFIQRRWPGFFVTAGNPHGTSYRLLYNLLAVLLLLPLAALMVKTPGPQLWAWSGPMAWLMNGIVVLALVSFLRNGSGYDLMAFLGLRTATDVATPTLVISDWHRFVRHPWYSLGLILIWTRDMSAAGFVSAEAITMYFIIGSRLEERKLVAEFGERYREYQRQVPRLFPRPWRVLSKEAAQRLAG